jgi:L,D-peptidoglycan transpeptidase YkuD (ErfK/YbiS/YcfS/YnhG family)
VASPRAANASSVALTLPLPFGTGDATQVITVTAPSAQDTTGVLQAWQRSGARWQTYGSAITAWLGSDGLTSTPSEQTTATPIGSFTLTQAFGRAANPGTRLPYFQTTPADWWISQAGPLYNTHQRCSGTCPFDADDSGSNPNEHLYYELPYYTYAVVVDANTANSATGVRPDGGSAYFLHVTVGAPTQGCVSVAESALVSLLRWLTPAAHPRILIGVS